MNLYKISNEIQAVIEALSNDENSPEDALEKCTQELRVDFNNKAISLIKYSKNIEADVKAIKDAEEELKNRRRILENRVNSLRNYLRKHMELSQINKIECPYFAITLKKTAPRVIIDDITKLPKDFIRTKIITEPDKIKLKKALELQDKEISKIAHLEKNYSLMIK